MKQSNKLLRYYVVALLVCYFTILASFYFATEFFYSNSNL